MTERADLAAHLAAAEQCLREYLIVVERIDTNSLSPEQTAFVRSAHALGKRGLDAILRYRNAMQRGRRWRMRRAWRRPCRRHGRDPIGFAGGDIGAVAGIDLGGGVNNADRHYIFDCPAWP